MKKTIEELKAIRENMKNKVNIRENTDDSIRIVVGMATCGIAAGARPVLIALADEVGKRNLQNVVVVQTGCIGVCRLEPIVEVHAPGKNKVTYVKMTPEKALRVIAEHIVNNNVVTEFTIGAEQ